MKRTHKGPLRDVLATNMRRLRAARGLSQEAWRTNAGSTAPTSGSFERAEERPNRQHRPNSGRAMQRGLATAEERLAALVVSHSSGNSPAHEAGIPIRRCGGDSARAGRVSCRIDRECLRRSKFGEGVPPVPMVGDACGRERGRWSCLLARASLMMDLSPSTLATARRLAAATSASNTGRGIAAAVLARLARFLSTPWRARVA